MAAHGYQLTASDQEASSAHVLSMLEGLHIRPQAMEAVTPNATTTKMTDLPQPWLASLVSEHLHSSERFALFQTCKTMAAAVAHHCPGLSLLPAAILHLDNSRRTAVFSLAAACRNVHLHVRQQVFDLDTASVWQAITQLTLCDVTLSSETLSRLHLLHLSRVHTITFTLRKGDSELHSTYMVPAAVAQLLQAGGLPALRTLQFHYLLEDEPAAVAHLAPSLGKQITHMALGSFSSLLHLNSWPALTVLTVAEHYLGDRDAAAACKEVLRHPRLRSVQAPAALFNSLESCSSQRWSLDCLHLTGTISTHVLSRLPLCEITQLWLSGFRLCSDPAATTAIENLGKRGGNVLILPGTWENITRVTVAALPSNTPTVRASFHPHLLSLLHMSATPLGGALVLCMEGSVHLPAFAQVPQGIHTLCLEGFRPGNGLTWMDIIEHVPPHIQQLVIKGGAMNKLELRAAVSVPPPRGLQKLILGDEFYMGWVNQLAEVRGIVSDRWPSVQLELYRSLKGQPVRDGPAHPLLR